jgi:thioredoxin-related protein
MDFSRVVTRAGLSIFTFLPLFLMSIPATAEPPAGYSFHRYDDGMRQAASENRMVFLYFGRYGCGFCDKTNKESFSDAAVKKAYSENYVLVYANSESMDRLVLPSGERITEMQLGERMNTLGTPVFFFLKPDGTEILKIYGFQDAQRLLEMDRYIQGGNYANVSFKDFLRSQ